MKRFEVAIVGGGLAGLVAAYGFASSGCKTLLIAKKSSAQDPRTTAIHHNSVEFIERIGLWSILEKNSYALRTIRLVDDTKRLIRAPQTDFRSSELDLPQFGFNLENRVVTKIIHDKLQDFENLTFVEDVVSHIDISSEEVRALHLANGERFGAGVIVAADGRNSLVRNSLGIKCEHWDYPQVALVGNFKHEYPHNDISTEFHTESGPFTLVPLGKNRSSLVCVVDEVTQSRLMGLLPDQLNLELEHRMHSILGKISMEGPLGHFRLSGMAAEKLGRGNVLLIGEAAHAFPPIGAQGLNLGLRDVSEALNLYVSKDKIAESRIGEKYHELRKKDVNNRTRSVDLLNRSLLSDFLPVQMIRGVGLYLLNQIGPLRKTLMKEGISPGPLSKI